MKERTRQKLIRSNNGYNEVYVPKAVCHGLGIAWSAVTLAQAAAMGATGFFVTEPGNGIKAKWPRFYFDLARHIEATFARGQWLWQPRDLACLRAACSLHRQGRGDEALAMVSAHQGVPAAEMPSSLLEQAGIA